jgi:heat shock protein HslJ
MKITSPAIAILFFSYFFFVSCNVFLSKKGRIQKTQQTLTYTDSTLSQYLTNGIDYYASGSFPENWSLTMDFDKTFSFKTASGISVNCPPTNDYRDSINAFTVFLARDKNQSFKIILPNRWNEKNSTTLVEYKGISYQGHGGSIIDKRLHNNWILEKVDDEQLDESNFTNGFPKLNFNLIQYKMNGFDGCNGLGSEIKVLGNRIQFGPIYSTLKACDNIPTEKLRIYLLNAQLVEYYFTNDQLVLYLINDSRLTFKKKY